MISRRSLLNLLLILCLLCGQEAALAHGISHLPAPGQHAHSVVPRTTAQTAGQDASDFCIECLAFAQVTTAAPGTSAIASAGLPAVPVAAARTYVHDCAAFLSFQARGPPGSL